MGIQLNTPVEHIPGILPLKADLLKKNLGVFFVKDLISHYPFRYIDKSKIYQIREVTEQVAFIQLYGKIEDIRIEGEGPKKRLVANFEDPSGEMQLVWFQGIEWHRKNLLAGKKYLIFGKPQKFGRNFSITHPEIKQIDDLSTVDISGFQPVYNTSESMKKKGLDSNGVSKLIKYVFQWLDKGQLFEYLPSEILEKENLKPYPISIFQIHFPKNLQEIAQAQRRIKFEEFFQIQIQLQQSLHTRKTAQRGFVLEKIDTVFNTFYNQYLPFQLTDAQKRVLKDVRRDVVSGRQMNRLIQGDVGSGKTIVALMSMLMAINNGFQACLMAPTEILSKQHFEGISELLKPLNLNVVLLTGSTTAKNKKGLLDDLLHGKIDILIGTHALIEPTVVFKNLGLVVIDEQHRFGVAQRAQLWAKNELPPHVLVMTATPIPRTLAMTLYGDLDYSVIDQLPPGRKPIATKHVFFNKKAQLFHFLKEEIAKGYQVYMVFPLIEESEKIDLKNLVDGFEEIKREFPEPQYNAGMLHGKMKNDEKNEQMALFAAGKTQILVATTVIEVGVNVSNATVMVIVNAERFGLSQLHQLRGRVGRGGDQSFCFLLTDFNLNLDGRKRMQIMTDSSDGFVIAEADLKMRGPGDISGTRQSGDIQLKLASIAEDGEILSLAQRISQEIVQEDPTLQLEKYKYLKFVLERIKKEAKRWSKIS